MPDSLSEFSIKQAFGLAYAAMRIAERTGHHRIAGYLQDQGLRLIEQSAIGSYKELSLTLKALEYYCRLGVEIGLVTLTNANILIAEIQKFTNMLKEVEAIHDIPNASLFPQGFHSISTEDIKIKKETVRKVSTEEQKKEAPLVSSEDEIGKRQSMILDRIKSIGNCHLKDIQEFLPDVSERTIRYDLQKLIERGLIERVGGGGPFSYYRNKRETDQKAMIQIA